MAQVRRALGGRRHKRFCGFDKMKTGDGLREVGRR